jgi:hypothetical protein
VPHYRYDPSFDYVPIFIHLQTLTNQIQINIQDDTVDIMQIFGDESSGVGEVPNQINLVFFQEWFYVILVIREILCFQLQCSSEKLA